MWFFPRVSTIISFSMETMLILWLSLVLLLSLTNQKYTKTSCDTGQKCSTTIWVLIEQVSLGADLSLTHTNTHIKPLLSQRSSFQKRPRLKVGASANSETFQWRQRGLRQIIQSHKEESPLTASDLLKQTWLDQVVLYWNSSKKRFFYPIHFSWRRVLRLK